GSDAIGGVVNVVTRKRIDGVQLNAYGGTSQHRGASVYDVNLLAGAAGDRGNFLLGAGYFDQQPLLASGRGWAASPVSYDFNQGKEGTSGSSTLPNVRVNGLDPGSCPTQLCRDLATTFGAGQRLNFIYDPGHTKAGAPYVDGWRLRDPSVDVYNFQAVNYLVTPSQRVSLFGNGEYRLADFARAYLQASYVQRDSRTQAASEPFVTTGDPDLVVAASNPYNPFGVNITSTQRRLIEVGERAGDFNVSTARIVAGFDGTIGGGAAPLGGWSWDVFLNYGRTAGSVTTAGTLNTQITGVGFGPGYVDARGAHCGTPTAPIFNCTPVNLFGPPGSIDPEMVTQLGAYSGTSPGTTQLFVAGASLTGEPFKVAADAPAALTIGFEHRNEYGSFTHQPVLA